MALNNSRLLQGAEPRGNWQKRHFRASCPSSSTFRVRLSLHAARGEASKKMPFVLSLFRIDKRHVIYLLDRKVTLVSWDAIWIMFNE